MTEVIFLKVLGITAEYNPFHNGHRYHIEESKKKTGCDICAVVMSGNFVQRGAPAICDKHIRASWAVQNGADVVFELPVVYALSTAEKFAFGAISLLNALDCTYVSFGAENSLDEIKNVYQTYKNTDMSFSSNMPFHIARTEIDNSFGILKKPNNILAFEYLKAIDKIQSHIVPFALGRSDKGYNSTEIEKYSSASAIRNALLNNDNFSCSVPFDVEKFLKENTSAYEELFTKLICYEVITNQDNLDCISEVREGIENRIISVVKENSYSNYEELVKAIKSKRYTYTAISRMLFQILLKITKNDTDVSPKYLRVLAFNSKGQELLKQLKKTCSLPIITKPSDYKKLDEDAISMIEKDFLATDIYNLATNKKGKADISTSPVVIS